MTETYLPIVGTQRRCAQNATAEKMAHVFAESEWQQRPHPTCHPLLVAAAQDKADDMLRWRYFAHMSPIGIMPNNNVLRHGYPLPEWYDPHSNNVESISLNWNTVEEVFEQWIAAPSHTQHITGSHPFFAGQNCYGTGYAEGPEDAGKYYVLISAPCPGSW